MSELNTINEAREMLTAILERKDLQVFNPDRGWTPRVLAFKYDMPDFKNFKYRVKPEPRRVWINEIDCPSQNNLSSLNSHSKEEAKIRGGSETCMVEFVEVIK